ncbi:hypothetical protein D3C81_1809440 [compost metagenome]
MGSCREGRRTDAGEVFCREPRRKSEYGRSDETDGPVRHADAANGPQLRAIHGADGQMAEGRH